MKGKLQEVIKRLKQDAGLLESKIASIGFDGFLDSIMRVVKSKDSMGNSIFFQGIAEFGYHIIEKQNKSCSIELKEIITKMGGNTPIFANALGRLGVRVNCIGAMGFPEIKPVFKCMSENCTLHSYADPGYTAALEFNDGKVMMAQMDSIHGVTWDGIKNKIGLDNLICLFVNSNLLGLVNWSEIDNAGSIWEGILSEVLPYHVPNKKQVMFFDISDCSKRSKAEIIYALGLIGQFRKHYKVILGLNENEAQLVYKALFSDNETGNLYDAGCKIKERMNIDSLLIHSTRCALGWDEYGEYRIDTIFINDPKLSTGGGDNFNAGFCLGELLGMGIGLSLILANYVSGFYVRYGHSPDLMQLIEYLLMCRDADLNNKD